MRRRTRARAGLLSMTVFACATATGPESPSPPTVSSAPVDEPAASDEAASDEAARLMSFLKSTELALVNDEGVLAGCEAVGLVADEVARCEVIERGYEGAVNGQCPAFWFNLGMHADVATGCDAAVRESLSRGVMSAELCADV